MKEVAKELLQLIAILAAVLLISIVLLSSTAEANDKAALKKAIVAEALAQGVDPVLALSIAKVESDFNPKARGALGEVGLFQLRPEFHDAKPGDVKGNIRKGVRYLKRVKALCGPDYGKAFFVCYNYGPNRRVPLPMQTPYYRKVQKAKREVAPYVVGSK